MTTPKSKFGAIFAAQLPAPSEEVVTTTKDAPPSTAVESKAQIAKPAKQRGTGRGDASRAGNAPVPSAADRRRGKSASLEYRQVTAYLRRETHDAARRLLIGADEDLSELLERLLATWVARKNS